MVRTEDLPPLSDRQERRLAHHARTLNSLDSWDFAATLHPATTSVYRQGIGGLGPQSQAENTEACGGVFEMEDPPMHQDEGHERQHSRGVSWVNDREIEIEQDEPDLPSSSDPSDSDFTDPDPSPSTSIADGSSPPSSLPDPTLIPIPHTPDISMRMDAFLNNNDTHEHHLSDSAPPSLPVFPRTSKSSPLDGKFPAPSPTQTGLWKKIKGNVRRPSTRDGSESDDKVASPRKKMSSLFGDAGKHAIIKTSSHAAQAVGQ